MDKEISLNIPEEVFTAPIDEPFKSGRITICVSRELERRFRSIKDGRKPQIYGLLRTFVEKLCDKLDSAEAQAEKTRQEVG